MADQNYEKKLESLRRYIPFLINMMTELKAKGNREAQLNKIQSLHDMITDNRKKLKLETLKRCEEVLTNIYFKVNPQLKSKDMTMKTLPLIKSLPVVESPRSTPASPSPTREVFLTEPVKIPTEKIDSPSTGPTTLTNRNSHLPKVDVYSTVVINASPKATSSIVAAKIPDMSKPPISLDDLKTLEEDVQQKISDVTFANASVDDLQAYRRELELQLRIDSVTTVMGTESNSKEVNTTVRNNPVLSKKLLPSEKKQKAETSLKDSNKLSTHIQESKGLTEHKTSHKDGENGSSFLTKTPSKTIKDSSSIFGNLLSSIDNKILEDKKKTKKHDRRASLNVSKDEGLEKDKKDSTHPSKKGKKRESRKGRSYSHKDKSNSSDLDKHEYKKVDKESSHHKGEKSKKYKKRSKDHKDKLNKTSCIKDVGEAANEEKEEEANKHNLIPLSDILLSRSKACRQLTSDSGASEKNETSSAECSTSVDVAPKTINDTKDNKLNKTTIDVSELCKTINDTKDNNSETVSTSVGTSPQQPIYKRIADKYNPKPKAKVEKSEVPEVDKAVSDSIENLMKISPAKPLLSPLGNSKATLGEVPMDITSEDENTENLNATTRLPDIIQKIFNNPIHGDIIPKRLSENSSIQPIISSTQIRPNLNLQMAKPGAIQMSEPPILSPPHRRLNFHPPEMPRSLPNFIPPHHRPEVIPNHEINTRQIPLLSTPPAKLGILPTPPIPPNLSMGYNDHLDMGYSTPRVDFDTPTGIMSGFESPRIDFEAPSHLRNDQFNMNPMYPSRHQDRSIQGFDPQHSNFMGNQQFPIQPELNMFNKPVISSMGFYATNKPMPLLNSEVSNYMPEPNFYQERLWHENQRWSRDRRPGDPRSYREYKEMREREAKAAQEKQKEIKDPRLSLRDNKDLGGEKEVMVRDPRLIRDNLDKGIDRAEVAIRDPRLLRGTDKSVDHERVIDKPVKKDEDQDFRKNMDRDIKAKNTIFRERSMSRTESTETKSRTRERESRFDKMYSRTNKALSGPRSQSKDGKNDEEESFTSPLDSLYNAGEKGKTGRGYGVQNFKIPKKSKINDTKQKDGTTEQDKQDKIIVRKKRIMVVSDDSNDDEDGRNDVDNNTVPDDDSEAEQSEVSCQETSDPTDKKQNKETTNEKEKIASVSDQYNSRIKVVFKENSDIKHDNKWKNAGKESDCDLENFVSEYDLEFQLNNKNKPLAQETSDSPTKLVDDQAEEPSSSEDVSQKISDKRVESESSATKNIPDVEKESETLKKPTQIVEADSSRKSDGSLTPLESSSKSDEPSEQNILAHFFENLLKSKNKKDKKTALFSLIETFSDSFDSKEIQKIRKIINVNEDDEQESDEEEKEVKNTTGKLELHGDHSIENTESATISSAQEEMSLVGSTTEESSAKIQDVVGSANNIVLTELLQKDIQIDKSMKLVAQSTESIMPRNAEDKLGEFVNDENKSEVCLEPVMVSVGERIKNRKRNSGLVKPRKKGKTELDLLHEDIQDMFIRDGVLTATGKRMCRILKDDPSALSVPSVSTPEPKKVRKKTGLNNKNKSKIEIQNSIKDVRIIIHKMPDDLIIGNSQSSRQLRSKTRTSASTYTESDDDQKNVRRDTTHQLRNRNQHNYAENDDDDDDTEENSYNEIIPSDDHESLKSETEDGSTDSENEDNKSQSSDGAPKTRVVRRRRGNKWASGIIPKNKKKKYLSKSAENSPVPSRSSTPNPNNSLVETDFGKLVEPDKNYYYDYNKRSKMKCKLCDYVGNFLTSHYLREHPHSEVLISRLAPDIAVEAIQDFAINGKTYESVGDMKIGSRYEYCCRVCGFKTRTVPIFFYEHITTHTGEYRHQCAVCEFYAASSRSIAGHIYSVHPNEEKRPIKKMYPNVIVFGYLCGECNFIQLSEKNLRDHVNIFHLGKPTIYKINMSVVHDSSFNTSVDSKKEQKIRVMRNLSEISESNVFNPEDTSYSQEENNEKEHSKSDIIEGPISTALFKKRPGPKSKTMPHLFKMQEKSAEEVFAKPLDFAVMKKPGPKTKRIIQPQPKLQMVCDDATDSNEKNVQSISNEISSPFSNEIIREAPPRRRRRSLDKLIPDDSEDDLDTIITLSSRSSRAAKEKATAKLKSLMESNEGLTSRKKQDIDIGKQQKDSELESGAIKNEKLGKKITEKNSNQLEEMPPPSISGLSAANKDMNVFTCKSDILEEDAKKIEEERLRKMEELNKSIGSRTSKLDFVDKLSNRLNNEQSNEPEEIKIKEEPKDINLEIETESTTTPTMPVLEKENITSFSQPLKKTSLSPIISKKPIFDEDNSLPKCSITFRQNKSNSLFSNIIEKLQGKINEASSQDSSAYNYSSTTDDVSSEAARSKTAEVLISIGDLVSASRKNNEIIYTCHANNCYVSTKDKMVFQLHCKFGHKKMNINSSLCEKCGVVVESTPDTNLLENLYDHLIFAHSDCLSLSPNLRMRRLSGDKLSVKKEVNENHSEQDSTDFEAMIDDQVQKVSTNDLSVEISLPTKAAKSDTANEQTHVEPGTSEATLELADDNPFSFKIASVMSLADSNEKESSSLLPSTDKEKPTKSEVSLKPVPPLTLIAPVKQQPTLQLNSLIVKEAKLTSSELSRPRKSAKIMQKFLETPHELYKCPHFYCSFSTNTRRFMVVHLKFHKNDGDAMVACVYCDMKTPWDHIVMHIDIRHANCRFACKYCLYRGHSKEYVCLHQEQTHPNLDFAVIVLTGRPTRKFSVADSHPDLKNICEPYRCLCLGHQSKEYLFVNEFANHLNIVHPTTILQCGYPGCLNKVKSSWMVNHWSMFHGVCIYQCGQCKTSSKEITKLYQHFAQLHPNLPPDILVRSNESLNKAIVLGYTKKAFDAIPHIKKVPQNLLELLGKKYQKHLHVFNYNSNGQVEKSSVTVGSSQAVIAPTVPQAQTLGVGPSKPTTVVAPKSNIQFLVASTSSGTERLFWVPMGPSIQTQSVTSVAKINKVVAQTSPSIKAIEGSVENAKNLDITSLSEESRINDLLIRPSSAETEIGISPATHTTLSVLSQPVPLTYMTGSGKNTEKPPSSLLGDLIIKPIPENPSVPDGSTGLTNEETSSQSSSIDDDILQTAIQSILDADDFSDNSALPSTNNYKDNPTVTLFVENESSNIEPVITGSITPVGSMLGQEKNNVGTELVAPLEHVEVSENLPNSSLLSEDIDPLNIEALESNEDSNLDEPMFDDINVNLDSPPEDPLTIMPTFNSELPVAQDSLHVTDSSLAIDPLQIREGPSDFPVIQSVKEVSQVPLKITEMRRSASLVSTSDDESDSSSSEKGTKMGLTGYQLYRCASCNLSFSIAQTFKSHITNAISCKPTGNKLYQCVHCDKSLKTPRRLLDHIHTHGIKRFTCSLCNEKFTTVSAARAHMKNRHSIHQTYLVPVKSDCSNMATDAFMVKPGQAAQVSIKDKETASESPKQAVDECVYNPDQIEIIPIRQIFGSNVKCGKCNYQTKVRVNIVRHLQMHLEEKSVPDTAPVNPVPCLEKNEKMFDKMINLAASSITGRMGGTNQDKEKEEEKYPEFIPSHRRFVCSAQGCSYLCPEEANLKHHLMALHRDDTDFTCAHCKKKIEATDPESVIKHFKLHGLHLYKCHYCNFVHHLKHKVERHISDGHLDVVVKVITIRSMETEPVEFGITEEAAATIPHAAPATKFKPWRCCMCKVKTYTKEDIQSHVLNKHDIDTRFKCTLCTFKNDDDNSFKEHFKEKHPNHDIDLICVYKKLEEELPKDDPNFTPFDTTPLWQRDKPRVRHIRGILFDESSPQPTKLPKRPPKAQSASSSKVASTASPLNKDACKNVFDCIDAVANGTAAILQDSTTKSSPESTSDVSKDKQAPFSEKVDKSGTFVEKTVSNWKTNEVCKRSELLDSGNDDVVEIKQPVNVIVIDSDDSDSEVAKEPKIDETATLKLEDTTEIASSNKLKRVDSSNSMNRAVKFTKFEDELSTMVANCRQDHLLASYGPLGKPNNKQWKCPKCHGFKSKRVSDFIYHIFRDFNVYRYKCRACSELGISYKYMIGHLSMHDGNATIDDIEPIPANVKLETWIHMVIRTQTLEILRTSPLMIRTPVTETTDITCYFCTEKFVSMSECYEHMLYHWSMMPYQCQHCPNEFYTIYDIKHHHRIEHPDLQPRFDAKGPTITKVLERIENALKRPLPKSIQEPVSSKRTKFERKETQISGVAINIPKSNSPAPASPTGSIISTTTASPNIITLNDDDDSVIFSKTDPIELTGDVVFACDLCAYMTNNDFQITKHLLDVHGVEARKYHILSKKRGEISSDQDMACNICDVVLTELKLRRHFLDNHLESHPFSPYRFKCNMCNKRYLTIGKIWAHFKTAHPLDYTKDQCINMIPTWNETAKNRLYSCTLCDYTSIDTNISKIRAHVKGHFRALVCNTCGGRFRYNRERAIHHSKAHSDLPPNYSKLDAVDKQFADTLKLITSRSVLFSETVRDNEQPLNTTTVKNFARKSTSAPVSNSPPQNGSCYENEYSYYGVPQEERDFTKISTTFELDGLEYTTTAEQMMKMFNMDTYVDLSDCLVNDVTTLDSS